jgi:hypothetical protein
MWAHHIDDTETGLLGRARAIHDTTVREETDE